MKYDDNTACINSGKLAAHLTDSTSRLAGGMFESVRGLSRAIDAVAGWRTTTFSAWDLYTDEDLANWRGLNTVISPASRFGRIGAAVSVGQNVLQAEPAVIHVHGVWGTASQAAWMSCLRSTYPPRIIVSPRGMLDTWALSRSRAKKGVAWLLWIRSLLNRAGCLHALGDPEARSIAEIAPGKPICVIPNGVDCPAIEPSFFSRDKSVLFLGRIHPKKGLSELLAGWAKARIFDLGWRLDIAGWDDGGYLNGLKAQAAALGLGMNVQFLGPVYGLQKAKLLGRSGAFVLPSYSEGLPMAVLEAWSFGLPVIMTDACNLPEGFECGAALRCLPDPENIAAALQAIASSSDQQALLEMGKRGRVLVGERYSWPQIGKQQVEVYEWLIRGGQRSDAPKSLRYA